jgi:hypothetical protein
MGGAKVSLEGLRTRAGALCHPPGPKWQGKICNYRCPMEWAICNAWARGAVGEQGPGDRVAAPRLHLVVV